MAAVQMWWYWQAALWPQHLREYQQLPDYRLKAVMG
jgi:hypothetical protein